MQVKISILAILLVFGTLIASAQTSDAEADAKVNLLFVQKKQAMAQVVPVSGEDSVKFWKIYDEYQSSIRTSAKFRIHLYEGTALSYQHMTPAVADSLAKLYFTHRMEQEQTLETYYKKIKAATNAVTAFEFYQGEFYLLTMLRAQIMQQIPTYGSLVAPKTP